MHLEIVAVKLQLAKSWHQGFLKTNLCGLDPLSLALTTYLMI